MKRALILTGILLLASCASDKAAITVRTEAPERTDAPEDTTVETDAPTTTRAPTTTVATTTATLPPVTSTTVPSLSIDKGAVYAVANANGLPPNTSCPMPETMKQGTTAFVVCAIVNPDKSAGVWAFTLQADSTIFDLKYTQTKAAPPTRATCTVTPPEGQFQKDSTATKGQCLHFWATVFQFDANTGPCSFLGDYGSSPHRRNYEFSDAIIRVDGGASCALLGPVVEDSLIEVWAVNTGVESYDTTAGGSNTYTTFDLVDVVVYKQP